MHNIVILLRQVTSLLNIHINISSPRPQGHMAQVTSTHISTYLP